ncbi:dihydrodipicolinate synthase family protein [Paenibacillus thalictri]|uniref:Dihydrodipicolinate synthase family protein n=1 Tax=Paenibacillus thalictri TaxID=2527873 RepID=A0A4Q9DVG7_9BACL|nr:dihydrodipicolinate synthase family protein [Paenibacillus thalictri]TBL81034.1 dihydrodipicolinate synthase family protein [Paenibacillus thalictri]
MTTNKQLLNMEGIVTVLNTPFTALDTIDTDAVRANVNLAIRAGVAGFLVPAMASEVGKLSGEERKLLVQTVVEETKGRVPVIGGGSAPTSEERVYTVTGLIELGCDGVLVSIPYENDEQYEREVWSIAELKPPFLMLQDWDFGGYGIPLPLICKLFREVDVFRSIKIEVVPAGTKYSEVLAATEGRLHVAGGWAVSQMIDGLDRGVHAFMPTGMHDIYTCIYSLYKQGERDRAVRLFHDLLPVLAFANQHLDISIHFFKRLLFAQGIYSTPHVREPILPFDKYHERSTEELIALVQRLSKEISGLL